MNKPGFVSLDRSGVNKESGERDAMPGFENFSAYSDENYAAETGDYEQDKPAPRDLQENPDVRKAQPLTTSQSPDRYYIFWFIISLCGTCINSLIC
jgi:hypothetical protein